MYPPVEAAQISLTCGQPLGQADLQLDVPLPLEASSDQEWYDIRSVWHVVRLWVRLTWAQMYPPLQASGGQEQQYYVR